MGDMQQISFNLKISGKLGYEKIICPKCSKETIADLHGPIEHWKPKPPKGSTFKGRMEMDNWWCGYCFVLIDREGLEKNCYWWENE